MVDAVTIVEGEVRELIRRRGVDPSRDVVDVRRLVEEAVADYDARSLSGGLPPLADPNAMVKTVLDVVAGLGPLQQYLDDPRVEEVWINERPTGWSRLLTSCWPYGGVRRRSATRVPGPQRSTDAARR